MQTLKIDQSNLNQNSRLIVEIFSLIEKLENEYPNFRKWYFDKTLSGIYIGNRIILASILNNEIAGISILKRTSVEKKICTFRIIEKYQKIGIGSQLMINSFNELDSSKPLITVSENRINEFNPILRKFGFELIRIYNSYYMENSNEYSFNGEIESKKICSTIYHY